MKICKVAFFTLMPSAHNNLSEKYPMTLTIKKVINYQEFSLFIESQQTLLSFELSVESKGTRVTINSGGFYESLANLKALIEGKEIPFI